MDGDGLAAVYWLSWCCSHGRVRRGGKCGIGAVVPWAGKLWMITYPPHEPRGGHDKLYAIDPGMNVEVRPREHQQHHTCPHDPSRIEPVDHRSLSSTPRAGSRAATCTSWWERLTAVAAQSADPAHVSTSKGCNVVHP